MKLLTRSEEMLLLAVWRLQDQAYAVPIREQLYKVTGKTWAFGALFVSLDRLVKKGHLTSYLTEPTQKRGGRSKRIYQLTTDGRRALIAIRKVERQLWSGISEIALEP